MMELTFEVNGISYIVGNGTLNILNLSSNQITENGLQALLEAVQDQDLFEGSPHYGLFKINLLASFISSLPFPLIIISY